MVNKKEYSKIPESNSGNGCLKYITTFLSYFGCLKVPPKQPITDDDDWVTVDEIC